MGEHIPLSVTATCFGRGGRKEGEGAQLILAYVTYFTVTIDLW